MQVMYTTNINVILKFEYFYHLLHENIDIIKIQIIINNLNFQFVLIILYEKDGLKYTETLLWNNCLYHKVSWGLKLKQ